MHDEENITFTVHTKDAISDPLGAGSWMKIYLNVDRAAGYGYVLNYHTQRNGRTTLAKVTGIGDDLSCEDISELKYEIKDNVMRISVPRAAIGLDHGDFTFWFKVADSREAYNNIEDFYDKGDVAPLGRLNFVYRGE